MCIPTQPRGDETIKECSNTKCIIVLSDKLTGIYIWTINMCICVFIGMNIYIFSFGYAVMAQVAGLHMKSPGIIVYNMIHRLLVSLDVRLA